MNLDPWLKAAPNSLALAPMTVLLALACVVAIVDLFVDDPKKTATYWLSQASLAVVALLSAFCFDNGFTIYAMDRMIVADPMGHLLGMFATLAAMVTLVYARPYAAHRELLKGELFTLAMFSLLGILVMVSANNFLVVYLGLELMSLSLYALVAMRRDDTGATEAAMKYFVLGALASGFLLYGLSMMYGATGSLEIGEVFKALGTGQINRCGAEPRHGVRGRRARLQARRGAVPHVGAGRLPGLAERRHADAGRRAEAGRVRDHDPAAGRGHARSRGRLAADAGACCRSPRCCSATSPRSRRPTSSGCWPIRRSRRSASCCSACARASSPATRSRPATATARRCST
jgi:hypothetical protein